MRFRSIVPQSGTMKTTRTIPWNTSHRGNSGASG